MYCAWVGGANNRAFTVIGVGDDTQDDLGLVCLAAVTQVLGNSRSLSDADGQHATGSRIKCACVPDALLLEQFTHGCYDIVRSHARGFVDVEYAVHKPLARSTTQFLLKFGYYHRGCLCNRHMQCGTGGPFMATAAETLADSGCVVRGRTTQAEPSNGRIIVTFEEG